MMPDLLQQLEGHYCKSPKLGRDVFIARGAVVLGDVTLGDFSSVWYNAVLRGDFNRIEIGTGTNLQDTAVVHLAGDLPCVIGDYVTVGHGAVVHACTVANEVLVGMRSIILDGAQIGEQSIIGAGALVPQGFCVPPGSLVLGTPARIVRALTSEERAGLKAIAEKYIGTAAYYRQHPVPVLPASES